VVPDACSRLGGEQVAGRGGEELEDRGLLERRRVRDVHDDVRAAERVGQALAGDRVDAGVGCRRERRVAVLAEELDQLRSDAAGAADDDDLHG
jgi:hypothetical protein